MTARATHDLRPHLVRKALIDQLDDAIRRLRKHGKSDAAVHAVRKQLKRARATLRLVRGSISDTEYRRDNWAMRDVARVLTPLRDAKALVGTLGKLKGTGRDHDLRAAKRALTRRFQEQRHAIDRRLSQKRLAAAAAALRTVKERIREIPRARLDEIALSKGLARMYKAGQKAFGLVKDQPTDERLHEWRKQVKYLLNQIDVARQLGAAKLKKRRKYSHRLADLLGDDHDLAVLDAKITAVFDAEIAPPAPQDTRRRFASLIAKRRAALQREAHRLGKLLYGRRPKRLKADLDEQQQAST